MEKAIFKSLSSILWIVMIWAGIYAFLVYKDMRFAPESYVVQIFLATAFFLSSMVSVPFNEERVLVLRLLNKEIKTLESGTYFYPFLGFWGKIYIPPEYRRDSKVIHIDTRLMRTHEIKTWKGDLLVSFMTYFFPMAKKFSFWNLMFCLVLGTGVGYGAVKIKREHFPDAKQPAKVTKMQIIKKELARSIQGLPSQNETSQNSTSRTPQKSSLENHKSSVVESEKEIFDKSYEEKADEINLQGRNIFPISHDINEEMSYDEQFILNSNIVFNPHLILGDLNDYHITSFLLNSYILKGRNSDGSFKIVTINNTPVDEIYAFDICFAYKGVLYSSYTRRKYYDEELGRFGDMLNIIDISNQSDYNNVYIANWKWFNFKGVRIK